MVDAFGDKQSAQRAYREVAYLQVLCGHPNITTDNTGAYVTAVTVGSYKRDHGFFLGEEK